MFATARNARLRRLKKPTTFDIHWAAGIYEGEGSVYESKGSMGLHVTQKDPWILQRLRRLFGGTVAKREFDYSYKAGRAYVYRWSISGARARGFGYTIYTLLSPRRRAQMCKALGLLPESTG